MNHRPAPLPAYVPMLLILLALLLAAWLYLDGTNEQTPDAGLHITEADWQELEAPGRLRPPAQQDAAALPDGWRRVALPFAPSIALLRQADADQLSDSVRVTWLKLAVHGMADAPELLALYLDRIKTDGTVAVYVNGKLAHLAQQQGPLWNSTRTPVWVVLDRESAPPKEILIRLEHSPRSQVAVASVWLGPVQTLLPRHKVRSWLQLRLPEVLGAAFLSIGLFSLCVWCRRRHEAGYLIFFLLSAISYFRGLHFYVAYPVADDWFGWMTINSLFWLVMIGHVALCQLHGHPLKRLTQLLLALTLGIAVVTLPVLDLLPITLKVTPLIYPLAALMGTIVCVAGLLQCWRRSGEGLLVAAGTGGCVLLGVSDWLLQNNFVNPEGWYLGAYTNAVTFGTFGVLLYRRYVGAIEDVESLNASLAQRLQAREAELEASHRRLREIELRQTISDERQRLMQDMHDGLGSSLISAIRSVERGGLSDARVSQLLKDCLDDLKLTIDSMEPVEADLPLLLATLRFRLEPRLEESGVSLLWNVGELPSLEWLDPSSALHILRTVQESIANILRHTHATQVRIAAAAEGRGVCITVEDNGQGFDVVQALAGAAGRGLRNQQRRARALEGRAEWRSGPEGARFILWLPLQHSAGRQQTEEIA